MDDRHKEHEDIGSNVRHRISKELGLSKTARPGVLGIPDFGERDALEQIEDDTSDEPGEDDCKDNPWQNAEAAADEQTVVQDKNAWFHQRYRCDINFLSC